MTIAGGTYVNLPMTDALVDGNLVSARTLHDNTALLKQFVRMLKESGG